MLVSFTPKQMLLKLQKLIGGKFWSRYGKCRLYSPTGRGYFYVANGRVKCSCVASLVALEAMEKVNLECNPKYVAPECFSINQVEESKAVPVGRKSDLPSGAIRASYEDEVITGPFHQVADELGVTCEELTYALRSGEPLEGWLISK